MIKIISSFTVLMQKAKAVGNAKKYGSKKEIKIAQKELDIYEKICLDSDEMSLNCTNDFYRY